MTGTTPLARRVLVTGALGNIGRSTVEALLALGHRVRAMVHHTRDPALERAWGDRVELRVADLLRPDTLAPLVEGIDDVIHLAYVIPPVCLTQPEAARRVNVDGTVALLEAVCARSPGARFLFASSLDVFGHTQHLPPPRRVEDPVQVTDAYTEHKLACEARVRESGLTWAVFRLSDVPPIALRGPVPIMFEIPLEQRIEAMHTRDAGLALARGAVSDVAWGRTWLIGGGPRCQVTYGEYLRRLMSAMELGEPLPPEAFTRAPYSTDWLDTEESQRLFQYQRASFDDIVADIAALLGWRRPLARLARGAVRAYMLSLSPYYRQRRQAQM